MNPFRRFGINYKIKQCVTFFNCFLFHTQRLPFVLIENIVTVPAPKFDRTTGKAVYSLVQTLLREKTDLSPCVLLYEYFDDRPYETYCDMMKRLGYRMFEVKTKRKSVLYLFGKSVAQKDIRSFAYAEKTMREQYEHQKYTP